MMNFFDFTNRVIDEGIEAARDDYGDPKHAEQLRGSLEGFEACRHKLADALQCLLHEAAETTRQKMAEDATDYWYWRCRHAEIEWVCNVVSAARATVGLSPLAPHMPTAMAVCKAAAILGVREDDAKLARSPV